MIVQRWSQRSWTKGDTYGAESSITLQPHPLWRLSLTTSLLQIVLRPDGPVPQYADEAFSPHVQVNLFSTWDINSRWGLNACYRYVDQLPAYTTPATSGINAYSTADLTLNYRPIPQIELSLVGKNLFSPDHAEFLSTGRTHAMEIPRSVFGKVTWRY